MSRLTGHRRIVKDNRVVIVYRTSMKDPLRTTALAACDEFGIPRPESPYEVELLALVDGKLVWRTPEQINRE